MKASDIVTFVAIAPEQLHIFWLIGAIMVVISPFAIWWAVRGL